MRKHRWVVGFFISAIVVTVIAANVGIRLAATDEAFRWSAFWFGDQGAMGMILGAGTVVAAVVTVFKLIDREDLDRTTVRLQQFTEAGTMMGSDRSATQLVGMHLLVRLAQAYPAQFWATAARALVVFMREHSAASYERFATYYERRLAGAHVLEKPEHSQSPFPVIDAFTLLGELRIGRVKTWAEGTGRGPWFEVGNVYLGRARFLGDPSVGSGNYSYCDFKNMIGHRISFESCNLRNAKFHILIEDELRFIGCDLRGAVLLVRDFGNDDIGHEHLDPVIVTENCETEGATVNDLPLPPSGTV